MVEDSLNIILKNIAEALNITAERLGGIRFAFSVGKNEYLGDENTAYTGGDLAALWVEFEILLPKFRNQKYLLVLTKSTKASYETMARNRDETQGWRNARMTQKWARNVGDKLIESIKGNR